MERYVILGVLGAVTTYPFIFTSIVLSPWFNIYNNALSDLGNTEFNGSKAWIFNTGLVLSGLLISVFSITLSIRNRSWKYLGWSIPLIVTGVDLVFIGVFPENAGRIHTVVSIVFFTMLVVTMLAYSCCSWFLKSLGTGVATLVFGIVSSIIWLVRWPWSGIAIQETVASLISTIWLIMVIKRNLRNS